MRNQEFKCPPGWEVETTGGGCQWLRRGKLAITDGDNNLPKPGAPCVLVTIDDAIEMPDHHFPSLEAALAYVEACERVYGRRVREWDADAFKADMRAAVKAVIAHLDRGTVAIGRDCLWQMTASRIKSQNGPKGTNAAWVARQVFNEVVAEKPFKSFVYEN